MFSYNGLIHKKLQGLFGCSKGLLLKIFRTKCRCFEKNDYLWDVTMKIVNTL